MNKLTEEEFKKTIVEPERLTDGTPEFDFWSYVDRIPDEDFEGHDCSGGDVHNVYRMKKNDFEHVLIISSTPDVFMAIVNNLKDKEVYGHCLLDFTKIYGKKSSHKAIS